MNSTSYDLNSPAGITQMSEAILDNSSNQPLIITNDIDLTNEEKHLLSNEDNLSSNPIGNIPLESSPLNLTQKQKSLISVYDNSNDGEQPQINPKSFPLVGILGCNPRSQSFTKRLILSGFPKPILCDMNSNEIDGNSKSNYVSYETFDQQSPSIILITDNLTNNFENLFNLNKQQLIIDVRELNFSKKSSHLLLSIPQCYQAFGNLSNWEIENGSQRVGVAIEQSSPINLIKFIHNLNCFSRGIYFIDQYSYNNEQIKSFRNCLFPFLSTIIIFSLCLILSLIEYRNNHHMNSHYSDLLYRQASSITGATSLTLFSLSFLIRPVLELLELIYTKLNNQQNVISRSNFVQRWLQSRRYLAWYSLSFAFLHFIFLIISKYDFNQKIFVYPIFFGLITLILLCILSFVYFPWISERLVWREYYLLTSYLGPFCLLIAFLHVFIHWKCDQKHLFQLKFISMILPFLVLLLRFIVYGIIHPINKLIQNRQKKNQIRTKTEPLVLP